MYCLNKFLCLVCNYWYMVPSHISLAHVHLQSRYPMIPCEKPWCYCVIFFEYHYGSTDLYSIVAQEHSRSDALPDTTTIRRESNTRPVVWKNHALPYPWQHGHSLSHLVQLFYAEHGSNIWEISIFRRKPKENYISVIKQMSNGHQKITLVSVAC